jgi:hypothetical protein
MSKNEIYDIVCNETDANSVSENDYMRLELKYQLLNTSLVIWYKVEMTVIQEITSTANSNH